MNVLELFPTKIGINILDNIPDSYIEYCKDIVLNKSNLMAAGDSDFVTENQYILDKLPKLKSQILKYINSYSSLLPLIKAEYQISSSWGYLTKLNNQENSYHKHGNSNISGVFYLTKGASLNFFNDPFNESNFPFFTGTSPSSSNNISIPIQEKQLILFPSYLYHCVGTNKNNNDRISIAFNAIPKGEIGGSTQKLNIK